MGLDYYKILGVNQDSSQDEIKKAYRNLCRKYHPDVNKEKGTEEKFKDIGEAFSVIGDEKNRSSYDTFGENWKQYNNVHGGQASPFNINNIEEILNAVRGRTQRSHFNPFDHYNPFENFGKASRNTYYNKKPNTNATQTKTKVFITLEEAYNGCIKEVSYSGFITEELFVNIRIPKGTIHGAKLKAKTQDITLIIEVSIKNHSIYTFKNKDIFLDLPIAPWELLENTMIKVPTLSGFVDMKIPTCVINGKTSLRLKGKGLPGSPLGDQIVTLVVDVPKIVTDKQKELYQQLAEEYKDYNPRENLSEE